MSAPKDVWSQINSEFARRVGITHYNVWIRHVKPIKIDENEVLIGFSDSSSGEKLREADQQQFEDSVRTVTNRNTRVSVLIDHALFGRQSPESSPARASGPYPHPQKMMFENYIPGPGNRHAYHAARYFVENPGSAFTSLMLHGPSGVGKTHLLQGIGDYLHSRVPRTSIHLFDAGRYHHQYVLAVRDSKVDSFRQMCRKADVLLMDDIHMLSNKHETQGEFVRTFLALQDQRRKIVLTGDTALKNTKGFIPAFSSRVLVGMEVKMDRPDETTRFKILQSRAGNAVPTEALEFLARSIDGNTKDLLGCLGELMRSSRRTLEDAQQIGDHFRRTWSRRPGMEDIARAVAEAYGVKPSEIYSLSRRQEIALARQACFYLARTLLHLSFQEIGRHFGDRDHTTVMAGYRKIKNLPAYIKKLGKISEELLPGPSPERLTHAGPI